MTYTVSLYYVRLMSTGFDGSSQHETEAEAVAAARKAVRSSLGGHALVLDGARLCATVVQSKGRVLTKRARA